MALIMAAIARRWRAARPPARRALRPAVVSVLAATGLLATSAVVRGSGLDGGGWTRILMATVGGVSVAGIAIGLLLGVLRSRLVMHGMAELVTRLGGQAPPDQVHAVLARLLGDPSVQVLPAEPDRSGFQSGTGTVLVAGPGRTWLPVGEPPVGVIDHDSAAAFDPEVVQAALGALRLLLDNLVLQDQLRRQLLEVQASRARIVAAADGERLRIERDLHDGAQQHLVSSALSVRLARQRMRVAPEAAEQFLALAEEQLQTALVEIRQLARGLHPAILTDSGIGAAVESLAQRLPVRVSLRDELPARLAAPVETAAYFVVCEALVNVTRYAGVEAASVRLWQESELLVLEVSDDGCGGADSRRGTGLSGLADRLSALAGTLDVRSGVGTGTTVRATIPLPGGPPQPTALPARAALPELA